MNARTLLAIRKDLSALDMLLERAALLAAIKETDGTTWAVARALGVGYEWARRAGKRHGVAFVHGQKVGAQDSARSARNAEIVARVLAGEVRADLAREYGVSRQRVSEICFAAERQRREA